MAVFHLWCENANTALFRVYVVNSFTVNRGVQAKAVEDESVLSAPQTEK